jgi:hypothetical protein
LELIKKKKDISENLQEMSKNQPFGLKVIMDLIISTTFYGFGNLGVKSKMSPYNCPKMRETVFLSQK